MFLNVILMHLGRTGALGRWEEDRGLDRPWWVGSELGHG